MASRVFVYGTLKNGFHNNHFVTKVTENGRAKLLCKASTKEKYPLVVGCSWNIPFLLKKPGIGHNVIGEIYEVDDLMLKKFDQLESNGKWYDRVSIDVVTEHGDQINCFAYLLDSFNECLLKLEHRLEYTLDIHATYIPPGSQRVEDFSDILLQCKQ